MKIIRTDLIKPNTLKPWEREQVYNGLDCCVTAEVLDVLLEQLDDYTSATYDFSRSLQAPVLEMRLGGVRIDESRRLKVIDEFYTKIEYLGDNLNRIVEEGVGFYGCGGAGFNWKSNPDLQYLFYNCLKIPVIKSKGRPTVDRNALEKLEVYQIAQPIVAHIVAMRELQKKIGVLRSEIDPDGRIRTSLNIAGTNTGRFSSSFSEFGTGTNLQNIEESLRTIFISDPGMKMAKFDAKSGESFIVGAIEWNLFQDDRYLLACETGDPHTAVAKLCWPELPWTGNLKHDKQIAEQPFYRHYTYRFMCKKLGHGSNYGGKPFTLSTQAKLPIGVVHAFQPKYFQAFPAHIRWHGWVENQLWTKGHLINLTGRKRWFFGRRNDDSTLREAIAYDPQGSLADFVNRAMLRIWRSGVVSLYMHDHDALTVQYPEEREDEIIPQVMDLLVEEFQLQHGRTLKIPYDCKVGWNKGEYCCGQRNREECKDCKKEFNPNGLRDYRPSDGKRKREETLSILDRCVCDVH